MFVQIADELQARSVDLGEDEYALLLGVCRHGADWATCLKLLQRMSRELTTLHPTTVSLAESLFGYMPWLVRSPKIAAPYCFMCHLETHVCREIE
jgi:hypothetical protein